MTDLHILSQHIQDQLDEPWSRALLIKDLTIWHKVWSSLYAIGDTADMLNAFLTECNDSEPDASALLAIYGALQALVVQQDAVKHLYKIFDIAYTRDTELTEIRRIRIAVCGHPVQSGLGQQPREFHSVVRAGMTRSYFTLGSNLATPNAGKWRDVALPKLIVRQQALLEDALVHVLEQVRQRHRSTLTKFGERPLAGVLLAACPALNDGNRVEEAWRQLRESWSDLMAEFRGRGSDEMTGFRYDLELMDAFVRANNGSGVPDAACTELMTSLLQTCIEIDKDFSDRLKDLMP